MTRRKLNRQSQRRRPTAKDSVYIKRRHAIPSHRGPIGRRGRRARSFSLAELMIAIVILGVGLLMVATMFPIAWMKARENVEATNVAAAVETAETLLETRLRASSYNQQRRTLNPGAAHDWFDPGSLFGDLGVRPDSGSGIRDSDARVFPVNAYNMVASPATYPSSPTPPVPEARHGLFVAENAYRVAYNTEILSVARLVDAAPGPQVPFEERLMPAMPLWPGSISADFDPDANPDTVDHWQNLLRSRKYCWAALARINNAFPPDAPNPMTGRLAYQLGGGLYQDVWDDPRDVTVYYVTLRRAQDTFRFPQQAFDDPGAHWPETPLTNDVSTPRALPTSYDVVFPVPWRVQVFVPNPSPDPTGLPSEIEVNTENAPTGPIVTRMLPSGAYMIDELNGQVYRVEKRKLYNNDESALLTLDREILESDLTLIGGLVRQLRTVWVFPPPVEAARGPDGELLFNGAQPVVAVDVRSLVISP